MIRKGIISAVVAEIGAGKKGDELHAVAQSFAELNIHDN